MKNIIKKLLLCTITAACAILAAGCSGKDNVAKSVIYDNSWEASGDGSYLVCDKGGSFKYYQSAEDLADNYFEGTYEFYVGKDAVNYLTTDLSDYGITKDELEEVFKNNEQYDEANLVCLILNNEGCIVDGKNQLQNSYKTPYFGFYVEESDQLYLDIANMNTGNYSTYIAK